MTVTALPPAFSQRLGQEIKALMGRYDISQGRVAALVGVSQSQMSKRLRGLVALDVNELALIAEFFGMTASRLAAAAEEPRKELSGSQVTRE